MVTFFPKSFFRYLIPPFLAIIIIFVLEFFLFWPVFLWPIILIIILANFVAVWRLMPKNVSLQVKSTNQARAAYPINFFRALLDKEFINFLLPPLLLTIGALLFIVFLPAGPVRHSVIFVSSFFCYLLLKNIFLYLYRPEEYQAQSLENITTYVSVLTCYFFATSLLGFIIFANLFLWQAVPIYLLIIFSLNYQFFLFHHFETKNFSLYFFILALLSGQLFWALNFLPLNFYVNGLILALFYYLFIIFSRRWLTGELQKRIIWHYLLLAFLVVIIILLSAQWK